MCCFSQVTDWAVDFNLPGGVDKEGWQYALDFPATYHAKKGFTDYVRRRRWFRKAQLILAGPWQEIGSTRLLDISILVRLRITGVCYLFKPFKLKNSLP